MSSAERTRQNRKTNPLFYIRRKDSLTKRLQKQRIEETDADNQVTGHLMGEPSEAFYPEAERQVNNVIFLDLRKQTRSELRERKVDLIVQLQSQLLNFASIQENDNSSEYQIVRGSNAEQIFDSYMSTQRYAELLDVAKKEISRHQDERDTWMKFSGRIFEDIAFGLLSRPIKENEVLLSPKRTYQFAKKLYPNGEVVKRPFEQNSIVDSSKPYVPDGLLVNKEKRQIEMVLECTANSAKASLAEQYKRFNIMKKNFPQLFSEKPIFLLVIPSGFYSNVFSDKSDVVVLKSPFSYNEMTMRFYKIWEQ